MQKTEVENHGKTQGDLASARAELDSRTLTDFGDITNPADCIEACLDIDPDDCDEAWSMLTAAKKAASKAWKFLYSLACVYKGPKSCPDCPPVEEKSCGEAPYVNIEREPTGGDMVPLDP